MSSLVPVLVPEELVGAVQAVVGVVDRFRAAATRREECFATSERELGERVSAVEAGAQALMLAELDETADRVEVGGKVYRRLEPAYPETYAGLRGGVRVTRHLYRLTGQHNGPTVVPLELRAGIVEGRYTPAAAVGLAHMNQAMPSREADEVARSLGVLPYSRSAQHRGGTAMGARWAQMEGSTASALLDATEIPDNARSIALAVDRVSMPFAEARPPTEEDIKRGVKRPITVQFRMAFAACWTLCDGQGKPLLCVRYGHVPEGGAKAMVERLRGDLAALKARRPELLVCTLADGSPEMQSILDDVVAGYEVAAQMVDFWHFAEYLGSAIKSVGEEVEPRLAHLKGYLTEWDGGVEVVEQQLRQWAGDAQESSPKSTTDPPEPAVRTDSAVSVADADADPVERATAPEALVAGPSSTAGPPKAIVDALRYIQNQRERLRYATAYRSGLPIGSGHVEATAKTIFETRIKRTGCRWSPEGGQALIGLRALATSSAKRWKAAMSKVLASFLAEVTPL